MNDRGVALVSARGQQIATGPELALIALGFLFMVAIAGMIGAAGFNAQAVAWVQRQPMPEWLPDALSLTVVWVGVQALALIGVTACWRSALTAPVRLDLVHRYLAVLALGALWPWVFARLEAPWSGALVLVLLFDATLRLSKTARSAGRWVFAAMVPLTAWCWGAVMVGVSVAMQA
jgi:tryptophan-rich sensory protein